MYACLATYVTLVLFGFHCAGQILPTWPDPYATTRKQLFVQTFGDHFTFGQSPGSLSWYNDTYANNSCKWDFHVQYLSGGPSYPGAPSPWNQDPWWLYYSDYVKDTIPQLQQLQKPVLPWFTFYALAQGYPGEYGTCPNTPTPPVCGGPAQAAPYNAQNATYMYQYWALFKTLMNRTNAFPDIPVVVHIEPDGWGDILLNGTYTWPDLNISTTSVCVDSSGFPDVAGFPDNILGFAMAFKKLRDTYSGQNVFLITNPSAWDSTGTMTGARFGAIMKELCGDWEGAVLETGDRDKGAPGSAINPPYFTAEGIPTVSITGNFLNHTNWIRDFYNASSLPVFIWQAASGNTIYCTCNQTNEHYEDNLMQTLLGGYPEDTYWISRYVDSGCFGWMFNPGQSFSTHCDDTAKDGITNPSASENNTGLLSHYADDDGGYTRLRGQAYYANPIPLAGIFPGTSSPPGSTPGSSPSPSSSSNPSQSTASTGTAPSTTTTGTSTGKQPSSTTFSAQPNPNYNPTTGPSGVKGQASAMTIVALGLWFVVLSLL